MEHKVTGCNDCCFEYADDLGEVFCKHPETLKLNVIGKLLYTLFNDKDEDGVNPDWCPLKKEPITISIEQ